MESVFITGTDTGVGKTTVSAGLLKLAVQANPTFYWKPIQTGTIIGNDLNEVKELTELGNQYFCETLYSYPEPVAPYMTAKKWNQTIELSKVVEQYKEYRREGKNLIIEGAGGLLVPLNENELLSDLVKALETPVIIVARNTLGTINQTLMTIRACNECGIRILGVVLTCSRPVAGQGNGECIEHFGKVPILAELEDCEDRQLTLTRVIHNEKLRKLFNVKPFP